MKNFSALPKLKRHHSNHSRHQDMSDLSAAIARPGIRAAVSVDDVIDSKTRLKKAEDKLSKA